MSGLRRDLADLDGAHADAPAHGLLGDLDLQPGVDLLAAGQHVLHRHVADHGAQRGGREVADGDHEVVDVDDRISGFGDLQEHHEVDVDEGVVLGDRGLLRLLDHELAHVNARALVDERDQDHESRPAGSDVTTEAEDDPPLVLLDDVDEEHVPALLFGRIRV